MSPLFKRLCALSILCPLISASNGSSNCQGNDEMSLVQIKKLVAFGGKRSEHQPSSGSRQIVDMGYENQHGSPLHQPVHIDGGRQNGNAYTYNNVQTDEKTARMPLQASTQSYGSSAYQGALPQTPSMITPQTLPQMQPGVMAMSPASLTGSADQAELMKMDYSQHTTEQEYIAQQKKEEAAFFAREQASAQQMMKVFTQQKVLDEATTRSAKQQRDAQWQAQEMAKRQQEMAQWQAKHAQEKQYMR